MHAIRTNRLAPRKAWLVAMGLVVVVLLMGAQPASGKPVGAGQYSITDLGTLGGNYSYATAINSRGQVVGSSNTASGEEHAFLWENGKMTDLGTLPGGGLSLAQDINNRGQVVGSSCTDLPECHAVLWTK